VVLETVNPLFEVLETILQEVVALEPRSFFGNRASGKY
jgi:hypothetical protein